MSELRTQLVSGLQQMGLECAEGKIDKLLAYLALLVKWNKAYNLTAIREPQEMVTKHLLDSLAVVPYLPGSRIIDVGTGGGLPGIPLAIMFPERGFTLLDSNGKKTRFLVQARAELGLGNVTVVNERVEDFHPEQLFDCVITRAFASVADMLAGSRHLLASRGLFLAMKGEVPEGELERLSGGYQVQQIIEFQVPRLEQEQRHLIVIEKNNGSEH